MPTRKCCTRRSPPPPPIGPCGCSSTQVRIDVTNADDIIRIYGFGFVISCATLNFTGFSAINGTYYVDWPINTGGVIELGRWAATNAPLTDSKGFKYCVYVKLELQIPPPVTDFVCGGYLCLCISYETLFSGSTCPDLESYPFINACLGVNCLMFGEVNRGNVSLCVPDSVSISQPTESRFGCPTLYYNWDAAWTPV